MRGKQNLRGSFKATMTLSPKVRRGNTVGSNTTKALPLKRTYLHRGKQYSGCIQRVRIELKGDVVVEGGGELVQKWRQEEEETTERA